MLAPPLDRAAAVRSALCMLVAGNGLHGAPMSTVANEADVATGSGDTHHASKDKLMLVSYCETMSQLAAGRTRLTVRA